MSRRFGLTLLEVIVVIAIIGVLMALLLPAVQYSREMSRRMHCSNNLRQFVMAISAYETDWRVFPPGANLSFRSPHFTCLPYLEQSQLTDAAVTNWRLRMPIYLCPSDGASATVVADSPTATNYVCNSGTWWHVQRGFDGPFQYWDDYFHGGPPFAASEMTRGLSNTSALSEIVHGDGSWHRMRVVWNTPQKYPHYDQIDDFAAYCQSLPADPKAAGMLGNQSVKGGDWTNGSVPITLYNHVTPPNVPSCFNLDSAPDAAMSASSFHHGIVYVAYLDGHVAPCSEKIDLGTWRSLATR